MKTYQITSPLAMCACGISAALSILLLIEPVFDAGLTHRLIVPVAVSVGLVSMAIITGVLAHGHGLLMPSGAALALVSVGLSGAIVWEQSGRRAQTRVASQTAVVDTTKERARLTQRLAEAEEILAVHRKKRSDECEGGNGKKCRGSVESVKTWEAAVTGYQAMLQGVPSLAPDAKAETIGTAAELLGKDAKTARAWVSLVDPLLVPLLLELAAILCGIVAFGPRPLPAAPRLAEIATSPSVPRLGNADEKAYSTRGIVGTSAEKASDEQRVIEALVKRGGKVHSQRHLSIVLGVSPAETCRMLQRCHPDRIERRWDPQTKSNVIRIRDAG